jgi:hypothetical protein
VTVFFEEDRLFVVIPEAASPNILVLSGTPVQVAVAGSGLPGGRGMTGPGLPIVFAKMGPLAPVVGRQKYPFAVDSTLTGVTVVFGDGTPPVGAPVVLAIKVDGATVATVTVPAGTTYLVEALAVAVPAGGCATMDIVSVGSSQPGSDMTASIRYT